jgi:hypothetical protein
VLDILPGGSITLNTSNPFDPPLIDPGLLVDNYDMFAMRVAIKRQPNSFPPKHGKDS